MFRSRQFVIGVVYRQQRSCRRTIGVFSAQKKWRPKLESDVGKIVATNHAYQKIFFATNQFIAYRVRPNADYKIAKKSTKSKHVYFFDVRTRVAFITRVSPKT
jgi:hypothetical protein